jgi:hypothetical protein
MSGKRTDRRTDAYSDTDKTWLHPRTHFCKRTCAISSSSFQSLRSSFQSTSSSGRFSTSAARPASLHACTHVRHRVMRLRRKIRPTASAQGVRGHTHKGLEVPLSNAIRRLARTRLLPAALLPGGVAPAKLGYAALFSRRGSGNGGLHAGALLKTPRVCVGQIYARRGNNKPHGTAGWNTLPPARPSPPAGHC